MTYSESKFREYLKKLFGPTAYIHKIPDKKQTNNGGATGLPDYLVIKDETFWFEVKQVKSEKYNVLTFNLKEIADTQWREFIKMYNAGAKIYIAIYLNKELYIISFKEIVEAKFLSGATSIHKDTLEKWRIKW
jgi:hypothetical protein